MIFKILFGNAGSGKNVVNLGSEALSNLSGRNQGPKGLRSFENSKKGAGGVPKISDPLHHVKP